MFKSFFLNPLLKTVQNHFFLGPKGGPPIKLQDLQL